MFLDPIPIWLFFIALALFVLVCIELGIQLGRMARRKTSEEKDSPISTISGAILGLLAFILSFTFGFSTNRFDNRRQLVLEDAMAIRTVFLRAEMLPDSARRETANLLREYLDIRLRVNAARNLDTLAQGLQATTVIHDRIWSIAVANAKRDLNSDIGALFIESVNDLMDVHARRVIVGLYARLPNGMWMSLLFLTVVGMITIGYHTGISGSSRTWITLLLALSFSLAITLIILLDRPTNDFFHISDRPLQFLKTRIDAMN